MAGLLLGEMAWLTDIGNMLKTISRLIDKSQCTLCTVANELQRVGVWCKRWGDLQWTGAKSKTFQQWLTLAFGSFCALLVVKT